METKVHLLCRCISISSVLFVIIVVIVPIVIWTSRTPADGVRGRGSGVVQIELLGNPPKVAAGPSVCAGEPGLGAADSEADYA